MRMGKWRLCVKAVCDQARVLTHSTSSLHTNTLTPSAVEGKLCSEAKETSFVQWLKNLQGLNHEGINLTAQKKNKLSNHTHTKKKRKRKRWGVFQWWIIKKHQSMKPMGSCIGNLQESWQVFYRPSAFLPLIQNRSNTGLSLETRTTDRYFSLKKLSLRGLIIPL